MNWPLQRDADKFYGNPRGRDGLRASPQWEAENLVIVSAPYQLYYDKKPIRGIRVHRKCAESLRRVFERIWDAAGRNQSVVDSWGASTFAGAYVYRNKRRGATLSMHAYGCALDLDPVRNAMGNTRPNFAKPGPYAVVSAFEAEGWVWGGRWSGRSCDGMHFQAARVNAVTVAELRTAGSRVIKATDTIKADTSGLGVSLATASALASQVNDIHGQITGIMSAVDNGQDLFTTFSQHWRIFIILAAVALMAYSALRIWRAANAAQDARLDTARSGEPGDQVLHDDPEPGSVTDGIEF